MRLDSARPDTTCAQFHSPGYSTTTKPLGKIRRHDKNTQVIDAGKPPDKREVASAEVNSPVSSPSAPKSEPSAVERLGEGAGNRKPGEGEAKETKREDKVSVRSRACLASPDKLSIMDTEGKRDGSSVAREYQEKR